MSHSYLDDIGVAGSRYNFVNPDFYRLVPWEGAGDKPVGYGFDSIAATIQSIQRIESETADYVPQEKLEQRQKHIKQIDEKGVIATPANSFINELVVEAARKSILAEGAAVKIRYEPQPAVL